MRLQEGNLCLLVVEEDSAWIRRSYVSAQNLKLAWPPTKGSLKSTVLHLNKKRCQIICCFCTNFRFDCHTCTFCRQIQLEYCRISLSVAGLLGYR